jgi:hypothetical protein
MSGPKQQSDPLRDAVRTTVQQLTAAVAAHEGTHPREEDLRTGLAKNLRTTERALVFKEANPCLPGWSEKLRGFDLAVVGSDGTVVYIETKWGSPWRAPWDVLKLASATLHPRVTAAYAVYAATPRTWARSEARNMFAEAFAFETRYWIDLNEDLWERDLSGSTAYPFELPFGFTTDLIAVERAEILGNIYDVRVVSVAALPGEPLALDRGRLPTTRA